MQSFLLEFNPIVASMQDAHHPTVAWAMRHFVLFSVFVMFLVLAGGNPVLAKRVALVIGNDDYQEVAKLQKAGNDATAVGDALESVGFEVMRAKNVIRRDMNFQLQSFFSKLQPGDEAVFFYAGHGIEISGRNYLLPTDIPSARPGREEFIKSEAIPVDRILRSIRQRGTRVAVMVLDACRDNPFPSEGTRSLGGTRGLARMPSTEGTFIMYSAGVGQTALDRLSDDDPHPNSIFTRSLVPLIKKPGFSLTQTARLVRREVQDLAGKVSHNQRPAYYDEVTGDFYFSGKKQAVAVAPPQPVNPPTPPAAPLPSGPSSLQIETLFWTSVKDSTNPAAIQTYLNKYPKGVFSELARIKLAELKKPDVPQQAGTPPTPKPPQPAGGNDDEQQVAIATPPTAPTLPPQKPKPQVERVTRQAAVWPIGKWPEGITSDGQNLWIAESGVRRVAKMDPNNGRILERVKVGRLPVDMVADPFGKVYSLVYTDGLLWVHRPDGKARRLVKLRDYPDGMVADSKYLWVLTHPGGSSANTKVVRIDHRSRKTITSKSLPDPNASALALARGKIWMVHGRGSASQLSVIDANTLAHGGSTFVDGFLTRLVANENGVFASGGEFNKSGLVVKYNAGNGREEARVQLPKEFVGALAAFQNHVLAIGSAGTIWVLSASDLSIERVIKLSFGQYSAQDMHVTASRLYITTHRGSGTNGSVLAVRDWQPSGRPTPTDPPAPSLSLGTWKFDGRTSAEESEGRGAFFSASVDVASSAGPASFVLSCFPDFKMIALGMAGRERFQTLARSALKAGRGRFGGKDAFIDLVIDQQPYPLKARFSELSGELDLDGGYRADGRILNGLLRSSGATLNTARSPVSIPLRDSTQAICQVLKQCGIVQAHCRAKGF